MRSGPICAGTAPCCGAPPARLTLTPGCDTVVPLVSAMPTIVEVVKGSVPFFLTDAFVLLAVRYYPGLATWLPDQLATAVFK